jgi:hypothetical protein
MIDRGHDLPITKQTEVLRISRGSIYYLPRPVPEADLLLQPAAHPHGSLTPAETPLSDAENLFREPGPLHSTIGPLGPSGDLRHGCVDVWTRLSRPAQSCTMANQLGPLIDLDAIREQQGVENRLPLTVNGSEPGGQG